MKLTKFEVNTPLWEKLTEHYKPLLAGYRSRLENPLIQESERIALCYQIKGIKDFLALADEPTQKKVTAQG